jgi:hydroxypyruvate isomerase
MKRREFLSGSVAAGVAATAASFSSKASAASQPGKFKLKYAPKITAFKGLVGSSDAIDNIKFCADQGFRAVFDNGLGRRPVEEQEAIARELARLDMDLGPFVASDVPDFSSTDQSVRDGIKKSLEEAIEVAKRTGAKWVLLVPGGINLKMEPAYQTANVIENCRYCCEILEESGLVMVLEPLNWWTNHPGRFLRNIPQAYLICEGVNHPCCKIVNDLYHQQISEGNLIPNIDKAWKHIAAFHVGDNPGRKEPGTGEINYKNVFRHIHEKGFDGVLCMEHGQSISGPEGEQAVIDAYRTVDSFE